MKHTLYLSLLLVLASACNETHPYPTPTCGNGILDENEPCDGSIFAEDLTMVCENGAKPNFSLLGCTSACTLDTTQACALRCGNGVIEKDEECDGISMPRINAPCDNPDMSKLSCSACKLVDNGICSGTQDPAETCGNDKLDNGEMCDGTKFKDGAKICPPGMGIRDASKFKCTASCRFVDISEACMLISNNCGNGVIDEDEWCDGNLISDRVAIEPCPPNYIGDPDALICTDACQLDTSNYCKLNINSDHIILLSEVVPFVESVGSYYSMTGLALEFTNMGTKASNLSACSLHIYKPDGSSVKSYAMSDIGLTHLDPRETKVICSQTSDHFDGVCDYTVSNDLIQANISDGGFMALECETGYIDILNLNSFLAAVNNSAVDFIRYCDQAPVTDPSNAILGEGWTITALTTGAPKYGLGEHCLIHEGEIESCIYTVDRTTLSDRSQTIQQTLDIKIPGITTLSNRTDATFSVAIRFITGRLSNDRVSEMNIHYIWPVADNSWINDDGIDRYIGTLHNYDTYEGFISGDEGSYVLDAAISFDNEKTWTHCGPKGIISDYATFDAETRNRLDVAYAPSTCGDGVISGSEVCDSGVYLEESLVCEESRKAVTDRNNLKCYGCNLMSTAYACEAKLTTCGNGKLDTKEVCDGIHLPAEAAVCPKGMIKKPNAELRCNETCTGINAIEACEFACGNGRMDEGEICDGDLMDMSAAEAKCKNSTHFEASRAQCNACKLNAAACIPDTPLVFDEFLVHYNDQTVADGIAFSINAYGDTPLDISNCTLALIDKDGTAVTNGNSDSTVYSVFQFLSIPGLGGNTTITPCDPLIICSETTYPQSQYKQIFGHCDAVLTLSRSHNAEDGYIDNILVSLAKDIDKLQITCDGNYIDFFDFAGLREAVSQKLTHGALKSTDKQPWPDRVSVSLTDRMDLDNTTTTFRAPVCD